jgi:hypothetical protein
MWCAGEKSEPMTLRLIPPNSRKKNKFYLLRGRWNGSDVELSLKTTDRSDALRKKAEYERENPLSVKAPKTVPARIASDRPAKVVSLWLVPPRKLKGRNPFFYVRGKVDGRSVEFSTGTTDETEAIKFREELRLRLKPPSEATPEGYEISSAFKRRPAGRPDVLEMAYGTSVAALLHLLGSVAESTLSNLAGFSTAMLRDETAWFSDPDAYEQVMSAIITALDDLRPAHSHSSGLFSEKDQRLIEDLGARSTNAILDALEQPAVNLSGKLYRLRERLDRLGFDPGAARRRLRVA